MECITNPGFIIEKVRDKPNREVVIPESLLVELEQQIAKLPNGPSTLYKIGKKFGYSYASICDLPTIKNSSEKQIIRVGYFVVKWIEALYASRILPKPNLKERTIELAFCDYVVCRNNGLGHIFSEGGPAGLWAWMMADPSIEGIQLRCQGRGDDECLCICGPYDVLEERGFAPYVCRDLEPTRLDETYLKMNEIRVPSYAKNSLKNLIDSKFVKFRHGQITYKRERFFPVEASFVYILEKELSRIKGGLDILWQVSYDFGKKLAEILERPNPLKFIPDFFSALGYGDIFVTTSREKYEIFVQYFPWLPHWREIDFVMLRGIFSGIISNFVEKPIRLEKISKDISRGYFSLLLTES